MKKMKKCLSFILAIVLLASSVPLNGFVGLEWPDLQLPEWNLLEIDFGNIFVTTAKAATSGTCGENLTWTLDDDGTLTISGTGAMKNYSFISNNTPWSEYQEDIKKIIIENGVTSIGQSAFDGCTNLLSVKIADSVTKIGDYAFEDCTELTSIFIPLNVTSIGFASFRNCSSLNDLSFADNCKLTQIGDSAFLGCSSLKSIEIPDKVTYIYWYAFSGCTKLESVTFGSKLTNIGQGAFSGCISLETIDIPKTVLYIEAAAFSDCTSLEKITMTDNIKTIGDVVFLNTAYYNNSSNWKDDALYIGKYLIRVRESKVGNYTLEDGTIKIAMGAFYNCKELESVTISEGIENIPWFTFTNCTSLKTVYIPDSVKTIDGQAFNNCSALTEIIIPNSVTSIGNAAFNSCTKLKSVVIGAGITSIGDYSFFNCPLLADVYYPGSEADWKRIDFGNGNENLLEDVTIHCNISGTFENDMVGIQNYEYTYNDVFFFGDSTVYNHDLAIMSYCLALSAMLDGDFYKNEKLPFAEDQIKEKLDADEFLSNIGFENCKYYGYEIYPTADSIACVIASKDIEGATVIAIGIRGQGYQTEWAGNVTLGTDANNGTETTHEGFNRAKTGVLNYLADYIKNNNIKDNVLFWVTGYSRAAATANLVTAELDNGEAKKSYAEISVLNFDKSDVFAYTFETPRNVKVSKESQIKEYCANYNNIFNIISCVDLVPKVAPVKWDYLRYGQDYYLPSADTNSNFESYFNDFWNNYNDYCTDENVEFVEQLFNNIKNGVKIQNMLGNKSLSVFFEELVILLTKLLVNENIYVAHFQNNIRNIITLSKNKTNIIEKVLLIILNVFDITKDIELTDFYEICDEINNLHQEYQDEWDLAFIDLLSTILSNAPVTAIELLKYLLVFLNNIDFDMSPLYNIMFYHRPELIFAWITAVDEEAILLSEYNSEYTIINFNCPIDVKLYDANGNLLAEMIGDEVTIAEDCYMSIFIDADGQKCFYLPKDGQYSFVITGNGEGTMSCSFSTYDFTISETTEVVNYYDLPVQPGQEYYVSVDKKLFDGSEEDESLANKVVMTNQEDEVIDADEVLTDTEAIELTITVENESENSYAIGGGTYYKGEYVGLSAIAAENETFLGWYMNGELISSEESYRFRPDADCTIVAKWEVAETEEFTLGDVNADGQITSADARTTLRAAVGLDELTESQKKAADADKNGEITSADARLILRASVGLENLE